MSASKPSPYQYRPTIPGFQIEINRVSDWLTGDLDSDPVQGVQVDLAVRKLMSNVLRGKKKPSDLTELSKHIGKIWKAILDRQKSGYLKK